MKTIPPFSDTMRTIQCTAASLRAMLCYIASGVTPAIAYDRDDLAEPLAAKLRDALGDRAGSQRVTLHFSAEEKELERQFSGCANGMAAAFNSLGRGFTG